MEASDTPALPITATVSRERSPGEVQVESLSLLEWLLRQAVQRRVRLAENTVAWWRWLARAARRSLPR